jgi:hypothetical protein
MPQNQAKNGEGRQAIVLLAAIVAFAVLGLVVVLRNR